MIIRVESEPLSPNSFGRERQEREMLADMIGMAIWDPESRQWLRAKTMLAPDDADHMRAGETWTEIELVYPVPESGIIFLYPPGPHHFYFDVNEKKGEIHVRGLDESPTARYRVIRTHGSCPHITYFRSDRAGGIIKAVHLGLSEAMDPSTIDDQSAWFELNGERLLLSISLENTEEEGIVSQELVLSFVSPFRTGTQRADYSVWVSRDIASISGKKLAGHFSDGEYSCEPADFFVSRENSATDYISSSGSYTTRLW